MMVTSSCEPREEWEWEELRETEELCTLGRLRERPEHVQTPVIFMTARAQSGEVEHYRALGALDVIIKPFDPMTLSDQIVALWQAHRAG